MELKCSNCVHRPVCSKYIATGGVSKCRYYKEDVAPLISCLGKLTDDRDVEIILSLANNRMNVSSVAVDMFLHRNTVVYHIEKIKRITGLDPTDFYGLCKLVEIVKERRK